MPNGTRTRLSVVLGVIVMGVLFQNAPSTAQSEMDRMGNARSVALSLATTALSDDTGLHANPASAAGSGVRATVFAREAFGLAELRSGTLAIQAPFSWGAVIAGIGTFGFSDYRETYGRVGFARAVSFGTERAVHVGAVARGTHVRVESFGTAQAVAVDAGVLLPILPVLTFGAHARNLAGANLAGESMPRSIALGLHYRATPRFGVFGDAYKDLDHMWSLRGGIELAPVSVLRLRAGATRQPSQFSLGIGLAIGPVDADLAAERHATLGWTPSVGFTVHW